MITNLQKNNQMPPGKTGNPFPRAESMKPKQKRPKSLDTDIPKVPRASNNQANHAIGTDYRPTTKPQPIQPKRSNPHRNPYRHPRA